MGAFPPVLWRHICVAPMIGKWKLSRAFSSRLVKDSIRGRLFLKRGVQSAFTGQVDDAEPSYLGRVDR